MINSQEETWDAASTSSESLEFPNRLFLLSDFDLGKYVTTAAINEKGEPL